MSRIECYQKICVQTLNFDRKGKQQRMKTYKTAEVATIFGIHTNTVRLYEEWGLIPKAERQKNGYRVFTDFHIRQMELARTAFQIEVLQNGLRKKIIEVVKTSAKGDFENAVLLTKEYIQQIKTEQAHAEETLRIVQEILSDTEQKSEYAMKRKEVSEYLDISMDMLRNREMNGLLTVKRSEYGYRVYNGDDINRLKIIRSLRCANYSLESILRMLNRLTKEPNADIEIILNTPNQGEDIISVCDRLNISLTKAEDNANKMISMLQKMKSEFS